MKVNLRFLKFKKIPYTDDERERLLKQLRAVEEDCVMCDFCGDKPPVTIYGANRLSTGQQTECWRWCACAGCVRLIDDNDWSGLHQRVSAKLRNMMPSAIPTDIVAQAVWVAMGQFFRDATRINGDD